MVQDQVDPRTRRDRGQSLQQLDRIEQQMGGPVRPSVAKPQQHLLIRRQCQPLFGNRWPQRRYERNSSSTNWGKPPPSHATTLWGNCESPQEGRAETATVEATGDGNVCSVARREAGRCLRCDMDFGGDASARAASDTRSLGARCH